jgi:hypothetical protein
MTSIAMQRISKFVSLTIEAVFSAWPVQSVYKEVFSNIELIVVRSREFNTRVESNFEMPAWRDMSLGAEELN